jgi:peptidyl-prolyl cis-trans isomerase C
VDLGFKIDITNPVRTGFFYSKILALIFISALLLLSTSCTGPNKYSNAPVVEVNGRSLTAKVFAERLGRSLKNLDAVAAKDLGNVNRAKEEIIRNFILQALTEDFAKESGLSVSEAEVEAEINKVRSAYPDDLAFRKALAQEDKSLGDWKVEVRATLLSKKMFEKLDLKLQKPTEAEIKKYYDENKERYHRKDRIFLRQIVLDNLTKAELVHAEVVKKKDFATLAKKYSVSPEAKDGGLVGWVEQGSVDVFEKAFHLPVGGVSPVLESIYGFHIFKTERKSAAGYALLDEVRPQIQQQLLAQKEQVEYMGWLDKQIRKSKILRNNELIQAISVETRGQKQ